MSKERYPFITTENMLFVLRGSVETLPVTHAGGRELAIADFVFSLLNHSCTFLKKLFLHILEHNIKILVVFAFLLVQSDRVIVRPLVDRTECFRVVSLLQVMQGL